MIVGPIQYVCQLTEFRNTEDNRANLVCLQVLLHQRTQLLTLLQNAGLRGQDRQGLAKLFNLLGSHASVLLGLLHFIRLQLLDTLEYDIGEQ